MQATSSWVGAEPPRQSPPPAALGHRRTPSEAERWLEEVAKAVRSQQQQTPPPTLAHPPAQPAPPTCPPSLPPMSLPPASAPPMSLSSMSAPSMSTSAMSCPPMSVPHMPNPPMSVPMSLPSLPCAPMSLHSGPPMSLPPMSLPSMTVPSMSGPTMTGAPMLCGPHPGAPGALPFPLAYEAPPTSAGMFGQPPLPLPPAFVPMPAYMAGGMAYPHASVPVVGITPSQMVANAFSAGGASVGVAGGKLGGGGGHHHGFPAPAFSAPPAAAVNGLSSHHPQNGGGNGGCGNGGWPQEAHLQPAAAGVVAGDAERFEAKWAALETKPAAGAAAAAGAAGGAGSQQAKAAPNPFSSEMQKTFEIEL